MYVCLHAPKQSIAHRQHTWTYSNVKYNKGAAESLAQQLQTFKCKIQILSSGWGSR